MNLTAKRIVFFLLGISSSVLTQRPVFGQTDSSAPAAREAARNIATGHSYFGIDLGATGSDYIGEKNFLWGFISLWNTTYNTASFATYLPYNNNLGTGVGFTGGIKAGIGLSRFFDIEWKVRYMTNHTSNQESVSNLLLDPYHPGHPPPTSDATNNYSLTLSSIDLAMLGHVRLSDRFYGIGGFSASGIIGNSFSASQQLSGSNNYVELSGHHISNISEQQTGPTTLVNWFNGLRGDAQIGIGMVYRIGSNNMLFDAEILAGIPLTAWLTKAADSSLNTTATSWVQPPITDPHLWYATLTIGLRLPFKSLPEPEEDLTSNLPQITPIPPLQVTVEQKIDTTGATFLSGRVIDAQTGKPVLANLTAVNLADNKVLWTGRTDSNGNYSVPVHGPGKFSVTADKNSYLFGSAYFEVDSNGRILNSHQDIKLDSATHGRTRLLVFFAFDKADLQPSSTPELNRAVELMKSVPNLKVEIAGYSDTTGPYPHNKILSLQRANAVRDYLVSNGISADRITAQGYGPELPIASNATEEGRAENRRVEFVVVSH